MMRRIWEVLTTLTMAVVLSACGGGGSDAGTSVFGGGSSGSGSSSSGVAALRVAVSSATIANLSPSAVTVTVTAVDSNNTIVSGASVAVTASNGGVVTASSSSTATDGTLTATVGMGSDTTPRTITVTAKSGSVTGTATIAVINSTSGGSASMSLSLSSQTVSAASPATVSVVLLDANGNTVPSAVVSFSTTSGLGKFSSSTALTNSVGTASVVLYPASSSTSGADYVVASATVNGTALTQQSGFQVSATSVGIQSFTSGLTNGQTLSAYGQTTLSVALSGVQSGTSVGLSIASSCVTQGKATITPSAVTTTNGTATFTYKDNQCGATGVAGTTSATDTVTLSVNGSATTSTLSIPVSAPGVSSLGFVSASPSTIYLKGSGLSNSSIVTFVVNDSAGNALQNKSVNLTMSAASMVGGLTIDAQGLTNGVAPVLNKTSDSNGQVSVRINSGTVPTPVRVTATMADGSGISTVSSNLSVAVGLPSELNFSLSQKTINIEGMTHDGTTNTYTVIASDRMGNPVPANTTINFVAEGSQIQSQGYTTLTNGLASTTVNFQSSEPRPTDGRVTILAYAIGEESFLDANGDNVWSAGESFQDLGDVFLSRKFSSEYNAAQSDQFIKGLGNSLSCATTSNPLLARDATIPSMANTCDQTWTGLSNGQQLGFVRRAVETVLSTSQSRLLWFRQASGSGGSISNVSGGQLDSADCQTQSIISSDDGFTSSSTTFYRMIKVDGNGVQTTASTLYALPGSGTLTFAVADANDNRLNPMPAGTTLGVSATDGITVGLGGGSPVPNTSSVTAGSVSFKFSTATSGTIYISTTSPLGVVTTFGIPVYSQSDSTHPTPPSGLACTQ